MNNDRIINYEYSFYPTYSSGRLANWVIIIRIELGYLKINFVDYE